MPDSLFRNITFDSTEITFDSCEITWDNCSKSKPEVIAQHLKISGGVALVVEHGDDNQLYSRIDVYHDISLAIKLTNPMFNDVGSHSIPFQIPASAHNLKVFGFPGRVERYTEFKNRQYPMYIYAEGLHLLTGNLVIMSADPTTIECYFKSGNGDFWSSIRDKTLQDIDLGESPTFANTNDALAYMNSSTTSKYPEMPFAMFPVVNLGLTNDLTWDDINSNKGWIGSTMVNYWDVSDPLNSGFLIDWCSMSPYLYISYIIDKLLVFFGYNAESSFINDDSELKSLVLYNNTSRFWKDNALFMPKLPGDRPNKFNFSDYATGCSIIDFIDAIKDMFCATLFVNDRSKQAKFLTYKRIISDTHIEPIKRVVSDIRIDHADTFEQIHCFFDNDKSAYHENDIRDFRESVKIAPVFNTLPTPGTINTQLNWLCLVRAEDTYYRVVYDLGVPATWEVHSRNISKESGYDSENALKVSTKAFTLPMYYGDDKFIILQGIGNQTFTLVSWPLAHQMNDVEIKQLNSEIEKDFTPRLLFYRGMQPDQSTPQNYYPLGTYDVYTTNKANGNVPKIPDANLALQWDGPYGLIENFYKEYLQWKMAGPDKLEFNAWFDVTELAALDFSQKYAINNNHMFLDSVEFALTHTGVTVSKVTAYKI
jgi:hypothetical protein